MVDTVAMITGVAGLATTSVSAIGKIVRRRDRLRRAVNVRGYVRRDETAVRSHIRWAHVPVDWPLLVPRLLIVLAGILMPGLHRARYVEEWRAALLDLRGWSRLPYVLGVLRTAPVLAWQLRCSGPSWTRRYVQTIRIHFDNPPSTMKGDSTLRIYRLLPGLVVYRLIMTRRDGRKVRRGAVIMARMDGYEAAQEMIEYWTDAALEGRL